MYAHAYLLFVWGAGGELHYREGLLEEVRVAPYHFRWLVFHLRLLECLASFNIQAREVLHSPFGLAHARIIRLACHWIISTYH